MYTTDEIRSTMESVNQNPQRLYFIHRKLPDRKAAANRYYLIDDILYDWHGKLNDRQMNTREMPDDLQQLYDQAVSTMLKIRDYERKLSE